MKSIALILAPAALLALSGCLAFDRAGERRAAAAAPPPPAAAPAPASPALAAVASATVGSAASVDDAALGGPVDIEVIGEYWAASGKTCRRVIVRPRIAGGAESRVACQGAQGWYWVQAARA